ncbi:hypothetical protein CIL05_16595 [Virgibacillus profundi]|uniref:G5 domain-containing protein n=1 Tax=Virgibacillus profundi TaxID=2024555 RepID=A0A2A2IAE5_9BACI|nr:G5 and 3D domain-containing protein [Virgibacillus profundi]PAV28552.1 hypothetical protein CIL05_16595 [Virgibacillus profundi]PXY52725.1 DUF348 domain-containing protein [Virgibacillus profundi]
MRIISKLLPASKMKLVISSIGVLALVLFSGLVLFEATKAEVVVTDNDEKQTVNTHTNTVGELLAEVGINVGEHDELSHSLDTQIESGMEIKYDTAKEVVVTIDGDEQVFYTTTDTIDEFLSEENLSFADRDDVSHDRTEAIEDGLHIEVATAYEVTINDGGKEKRVWTTGSTVGELLDSNQIKVNKKLDKIKPAIDEKVTKDTTITIVQVKKETEEVTEKVAFDTEKKNDSSLLKGKEQVVTQGQAGKIVKKYEVLYENGKEVSRELVSEEVTEDSKNQVVAIGTKEPVQKKETNLVTLSSKKSNSANSSKKSSTSNTSSSKANTDGKVFTMSASAYTASCSGCSGFTATGINLAANPNMKVIAVDPNIIPLGSRVWVEGYGEAIAGDTGGHIKGNRIDVHVPSKSAAYKWGRKTVTVKVLN